MNQIVKWYQCSSAAMRVYHNRDAQGCIVAKIHSSETILTHAFAMAVKHLYSSPICLAHRHAKDQSHVEYKHVQTNTQFTEARVQARFDQ
jgi:hypothetical protein